MEKVINVIVSGLEGSPGSIICRSFQKTGVSGCLPLPIPIRNGAVKHWQPIRGSGLTQTLKRCAGKNRRPHVLFCVPPPFSTGIRRKQP